jgi:hypothetical protein
MNLLLTSFDLFRRTYRTVEIEKKLQDAKRGLYALKVYDKTNLKKAYFIATAQLAGADIGMSEELLQQVVKDDKPLMVAVQRDKKIYFYRFTAGDIERNHTIRLERWGTMVYFSIRLGHSLQGKPEEPKIDNKLLDTLKEQFDLQWVG